MDNEAGEAGSLDEVGGHCPQCLAEYRPGFDTCTDCGVPLKPGPPRGRAEQTDAWTEANTRVWASGAGSDPAAARDHDPPVVIAKLPWQDAFLLAGSLRSGGIEAFLYPPDPPTQYAYGELFHRLYQVLVRPSNVDEARAIAAEVSPE